MPAFCARPHVPFGSPTPMYAPAYHVASDFYDRSQQAFPSILEPTLYALGTPRVPALGWFPEAQHHPHWGLQGGLCPVAPTSLALGSPSSLDPWVPCLLFPAAEKVSLHVAPLPGLHVLRALRFQPPVRALTPWCLHTDHQVLRT